MSDKPDTPLSMLLEKQLSLCKLSGTSITESGLTVSTDKRSGENIIFFRIDSDGGRKCLNMIGLRCCDCLVFYTKASEEEEKFCFLELKKPAKLGDAVDQIIEAHKYVVRFLEEKQMLMKHVVPMTFICLRHQSPGESMTHRKRLAAIFGKNVCIKTVTGHYKELGSFLRQHTTQ